MKFPRLSRETPPPPRPPHGADVLRGVEDEVDDGIEFDPTRDILKSDVKCMKEVLERWRQAGNWYSYGDMATSLVFLFPEQREELNLDEEVWEGMKSKLGEWRQAAQRSPENWRGFRRLAAALAFLFPDRRDMLGLDEEVWEGMTMALDIDRGNVLWAVSSTITEVALFFPKHTDKLGSDEEVWEEINKTRAFRHRIAMNKRWSHLSTADAFVHATAKLFLLFQERREELKLDEKAWEQMKERLEKGRRAKDWQRFGYLAMSLTILASQDARITNDGRIEITPKKPKLAAAPAPLPARPR